MFVKKQPNTPKLFHPPTPAGEPSKDDPHPQPPRGLCLTNPPLTPIKF